MCTIVTYAPDDPDVGGGDIGYSSRKETPEGRFVNATGEKKEGKYFGLTRLEEQHLCESQTCRLGRR